MKSLPQKDEEEDADIAALLRLLLNERIKVSFDDFQEDVRRYEK
jgi:hypothetical protein